MKRLVSILAIIITFVATASFAVTQVQLGTNPFAGSVKGQGFDFTVTDIDVGNSAFELVTQDTGFTQMSTDAAISVTYEGSNGDTAVVILTGIRPWAAASAQRADSLRYLPQLVKVDGGDTVTVDSTNHLFENAWVDSAMGAAVVIFADAATVRGSVLDTIAANSYTLPLAHQLFGRHDRPVIDRIHYTVFSTTGTQGVRFEFRVYPNLRGALDYSSDYYVADYVYVRPENGEVITSFGSGDAGMAIPSGAGIAVVARGDVDNMTAKVRMVGRRQGR